MVCDVSSGELLCWCVSVSTPYEVQPSYHPAVFTHRRQPVVIDHGKSEQEAIWQYASSSFLPHLSQLIESLSANDEGSKAQQALSNILGVDAPLDSEVEDPAGAFAA